MRAAACGAADLAATIQTSAAASTLASAATAPGEAAAARRGGVPLDATLATAAVAALRQGRAAGFGPPGRRSFERARPRFGGGAPAALQRDELHRHKRKQAGGALAHRTRSKQRMQLETLLPKVEGMEVNALRRAAAAQADVANGAAAAAAETPQRQQRQLLLLGKLQKKQPPSPQPAIKVQAAAEDAAMVQATSGSDNSSDALDHTVAPPLPNLPPEKASIASCFQVSDASDWSFRRNSAALPPPAPSPAAGGMSLAVSESSDWQLRQNSLQGLRTSCAMSEDGGGVAFTPGGSGSSDSSGSFYGGGSTGGSSGSDPAVSPFAAYSAKPFD